MSSLHHGIHLVVVWSVASVIPRPNPQCCDLQISLKCIKCGLDYIRFIYVLHHWFSPVWKLVTALTTVGENFHVFHGVSHSVTNHFLWIMALSFGNISLQKCYSKTFSATNHFPPKTWMLFPVEVLLYIVLLKMWTHIMGPYSPIKHSG